MGKKLGREKVPPDSITTFLKTGHTEKPRQEPGFSVKANSQISAC